MNRPMTYLAPINGAAAQRGSKILVVDDEESNRILLCDMLEDKGYKTSQAVDGAEALCEVERDPPDLILLDLMMPGLNGFEVCRRLKQNPETAVIPVLMVTALSERRERILGVEAGANDFLTKPVDMQDLTLRVRNALHAKALYDQLKIEQQKAEDLLLNTLPGTIAERLKKGEFTIADHYPEATVLVADLVHFTALMNLIGPNEVVFLLNEIFSSFDILTEALRLEKVKTVGDAYMVAGGINSSCLNPAKSMAELAIQMQRAIARFNLQYGASLRMRIGISTGPVVAGVIGRKKFAFDIWGETVNLACALESIASPGSILVDQETCFRLQGDYMFAPVRTLQTKNGGKVTARALCPSAETADETDGQIENATIGEPANVAAII
jgi:adenylate cyclase